MRIQVSDLKPEEWLCWRVPVKAEGEDTRLLLPHANPHLHEFPLDGLFKTPEQAIEYLHNFGACVDEEFVLCKISITPLEAVKCDDPTADSAEDMNIIRNQSDIELLECDWEDV